jgi:negative regulator of flagellin synthesis FlgM
MDGINSLHKMLGALQTSDSASVNTAAKASAAASPIAGSSADSAKLSAAGGMASQATDTSDVRMDKVAALQQAIASGSYSIPASAVADKMVESLLK